MAEDTLNKRYYYKLSTNLVNLVVNLIIQSIVPRTLGPKAYGSFNFLTNFFQQFLGLFDLWITPCFYIKLTQKPKDHILVTFVFYFVIFCSLLLLLSIFLINPESSFYKQIWPEQYLFYINLAAIWAILNWINQLMNNMADAYGLTVKSEKIRMTQKVISLFIILIIFLMNKLTLDTFFYYNYAIMIFLAVSVGWIIIKNGYQPGKLSIPLTKIKEYASVFHQYSSPLVATGIVALIFGIIDRWLLQYFGGNVQQGFYGLSYQIGMVCFLFTSAMTPLIMREFSIAFNEKNIDKIKYLFRKYIPLLYSIAAYISCFLAVQAEKVIYIMGGSQYKEALMAVAIMSFYPIHQTYGQLSGSVFITTGQTKLYSKIGIIFLLIGLPLTFFLIASNRFFGLNAGATGLSIKMVLIQVIAVNIQLYYNSKYLGLSFSRYLAHQILSVIAMLSLSISTLYFVDIILGLKNRVIFDFLLSGIIYSTLVVILTWFIPDIFGMKKEDLSNAINFFKKKFKY